VTPSKIRAPISRHAYTVVEGAASIGMGPGWFREHVLPDLQVVRVRQAGKATTVLVPPSEIERWVREHLEAAA